MGFEVDEFGGGEAALVEHTDGTTVLIALDGALPCGGGVDEGSDER